MVCSAAIGPMTLALTPLLVAPGVAHLDRIAEKRLETITPSDPSTP
jgi:hypothetical protein